MAFGSCLVIHCEYWRGTMDTMLPCTPEAEFQQAETSVWVPATRADAAGVSAYIRRSSHWAHACPARRHARLNSCSRSPSLIHKGIA